MTYLLSSAISPSSVELTPSMAKWLGRLSDTPGICAPPMLHRIAHAPSRRRRGPIRCPRTPWRWWRSLRAGTTTGRPGTEIHGAGRGRTIEAQWQDNRPLKVLHRAFKKALRRGSRDYHGKRQGGHERTARHLPDDVR